MNSFLSQTMRLHSVWGIVLVIALFYSLSVSAQVETKTVSTMQIASANEKQMPSNTSFQNICDPVRKTSRQQADELTVSCRPSSPSASARLTAKPDVQRSDVNCKFTENDEGGFDVQSCTCKADSDSNCTGFITWCAKQGGDVGGNNQSASCG